MVPPTALAATEFSSEKEGPEAPASPLSTCSITCPIRVRVKPGFTPLPSETRTNTSPKLSKERRIRRKVPILLMTTGFAAFAWGGGGGTHETGDGKTLYA